MVVPERLMARRLEYKGECDKSGTPIDGRRGVSINGQCTAKLAV